MSSLRKNLERDRAAYAQAQFPGDLGEIALAEPSPRRPRRWAAAATLAVAASLLAVVALSPDEPSAPKPSVKRPPLMTQMARVSRLEASPRPRLRLGRISSATRPRSIPTRRSAVGTTAPPLQASTLAARQQLPPARRRDLSTPSLALRSMNDAISFGT